MVEIAILDTGAFAHAELTLSGHERFVSESGALFHMSANVDVDVTTRSRGRGGVLAGLGRLLGGDSFFLSSYTLTDGAAGTIGLAPILPGDVARLEVDPDRGWITMGGSFLGAGAEVALETRFQGLRGMLSGEGLFLEAVRRHMAQLGQVMSDAVSGPGPVAERLECFLREYLAWLDSNQDALKLMVACRHTPDDGQPELDMMSMHRQHGEILGGLLAEGVSEGTIRKDLDPQDLVMGLIGMANIFAMARMFGAVSSDADHPQRLLELYLYGASPR